eukprot:GHVL01039719.1.p1 GENE.GHVL01039719.1~~GHVL01039719.1.p1  ORF type:complete len:661 (+),score=122.90 GHVL01039719.1:103-2085(+)
MLDKSCLKDSSDDNCEKVSVLLRLTLDKESLENGSLPEVRVTNSPHIPLLNGTWLRSNAIKSKKKNKLAAVQEDNTTFPHNTPIQYLTMNKSCSSLPQASDMLPSSIYDTYNQSPQKSYIPPYPQSSQPSYQTSYQQSTPKMPSPLQSSPYRVYNQSTHINQESNNPIKKTYLSTQTILNRVPIIYTSPNQPTAQRISQPVTHQPMTQRISQPVTHQPMTQRISQPVTHQPMTQRISQPVTHQPITQRISQPVTHQPITQRISQPVRRNSSDLSLHGIIEEEILDVRKYNGRSKTGTTEVLEIVPIKKCEKWDPSISYPPPSALNQDASSSTALPHEYSLNGKSESQDSFDDFGLSSDDSKTIFNRSRSNSPNVGRKNNLNKQNNMTRKGASTADSCEERRYFVRGSEDSKAFSPKRPSSSAVKHREDNKDQKKVRQRALKSFASHEDNGRGALKEKKYFQENIPIYDNFPKENENFNKENDNFNKKIDNICDKINKKNSYTSDDDIYHSPMGYDSELDKKNNIYEYDKNYNKNNLDDEIYTSVYNKRPIDNDSDIDNRLKNGIISPKNKDISPKNKDISPRNKDISPKNKDISPNNKDISPKNKDISPKNKDISPKNKDISPKNKDISQKNKDISQKNKDISPKNKDISPRNKDISPKK